MKKLIALLFGASMTAAAAFGGCAGDLDRSLLFGTPGPENCTRLGCYWLQSPDHVAWTALDDGVNPPHGQDTIFYRSGLTYREVLDRPSSGLAYYVAAYHFIGVELNKLAGASLVDVNDAFETTRAIFVAYTPGDVEADAALDARLRDLASTMMAFNTGELGPGTCGCPLPEAPLRAGDDDQGLATSSAPGTAAGSDMPPPPPPPPIDAGVPPPPPPSVDAGVPPSVDAGVPSVDAGVPSVDAGEPPPPPPPPEDPCACRDTPDHV